MIIQVDTREQANTHVLREFDRQGIEYYDEMLNFGDYWNPETNIVVERKKNLIELAGNCGKGHQRFKSELERLGASTAKMYIVIEQDFDYNKLDEWINPRGRVKHRKLAKGVVKIIRPMSGAQMKKICDKWLEKHNIEFVFVPKKESGKTIVEILGGAYGNQETRNDRGDAGEA